MGGVYLKSMADSWISLMNFWELWSIISHDKHLYLTLLKSYSLILCSCLSVPTRHSLTRCKVFLAVFRSSKRALVEDVREIQLSCTVLSLYNPSQLLASSGGTPPCWERRQALEPFWMSSRNTRWGAGGTGTCKTITPWGEIGKASLPTKWKFSALVNLICLRY